MLHRSAATLAVATFFSCGSAQILTPAPLVDGSVAASACVGSQDCPEGSLCLDGACHAWTSEEEPAADAAVVDAGARDAEATSGPDAESGVDAGSIVTDSVDSGWFPADASLAGAPDSSACQPTTCSSLGAECGTWPNGCGNALSCGACGGSTTCQQGHCVGSSQVDCSGIAGHPGFELCTQTDQSCAGVFTNGAGCSAFCAAAGLRCVARYGGDTGCQKESQVVLTCDEANGHLSDWCECGLDASCQSATCASLGAECGTWPDGCGNDLTCGSCSGSSTCQQGHCVGSSVLDCSAIASHSGFELCTQTDEICAGVFTNGAGCTAYCASAGLRCTARYGGDPGCQKEALTMLVCDDDNGHLSDWCECGAGTVVPPDPTCSTSASNPPRPMEIRFGSATYQNRSAWVLECRDYAYTAFQSEHEECDSQYQAGSARGSAHFMFSGVPRGRYDVILVGMHTTNRNPSGALIRVRVDGTEQVAMVNQRDDAGMTADTVGNYCLGGSVEVVVDSTVSAQSDSVQKIRLVPNSTP